MAVSEGTQEDFANAQSLMRGAASLGATLICLPELFLHRYLCHLSIAQLILRFIDCEST
jgi:predicted amidohydrolase